MNSVLNKIVARVLQDEEGLSVETPTQRNLPIDVEKLMKDKFFLIAEAKHKSPSKGLLRDPFCPGELAVAYESGGASAISVVTEKHHFGGLPEYLTLVKNLVDVPVLRKDFIVTERQVIESYNLGADMMLLISAILDKAQLRDLHCTAVELGLTPMVEIHSLSELEKALFAEPLIIGINNRDLNDFSVDTGRTLEIKPEVPSGIRVISESGIKNHTQIRRLKNAGVSGALVGETLLLSPDPVTAVRELLHG